MENYLLLKDLIAKVKEYIFIILSATILLIISCTISYSEENIFTVNNIKVQGKVDLNFSRDKYINKAFNESFEMLMSRILLSKDLNKIKDIKKNKIRYLINSFQILEETYRKDKYNITLKISYNEKKVKKLLLERNISFSQPKKITSIFFPILFVNDEIKNFNENYFYNQWRNIEIKNEIINFILPIDDLDDISKIKEMKNKIGQLDVRSFIKKYNVQNYAFTLMNYDKKKLNIYIMTNFEGNEMSKNISYEVDNFDDELKLNFILKDLKTQITDIWKEINIVNLLMPLSIKVKYKHNNLIQLNEFKKILYDVSIIDSFDLEKFSINNSYFKIYYYGNPKRLQSELFKFGYQLKNDQGYWELYMND